MIKIVQWYGSMHRESFVNDRVYENIMEHSFDYTTNIYKLSMDSDLSDKYTIDSIPIASGSIGQVYKGIENATKREIVIKVRHPDVYKNASTHINYIKYISNIFAFLRVGKTMNTIIDIDMFFKMYTEQINMTNEAMNMNKLRHNFEGSSMVIVPTPLEWSEDILVMTYHNGTHLDVLKENEYVFHKVSLMLFIVLRVMSMTHGFIHCDMHKGNWRYDEIADSIVIYDTGYMMEVDSYRVTRIMKETYGTSNTSVSNSIREYLMYSTNDIINRNEIELWLSENPDLINEETCQSKMCLKGIVRFSSRVGVPVSHIVLSMLLASIAIENDILDNDMISTSNNMNNNLKSELSMCRKHKSFRQHQNFLLSIIRNDDTFDISTLDVSNFYNIRNT
jgi:hypothetical protein